MVLNDGMSAVLKRITSALDTTLNAFEQVQRASGRAVDATQIAQARSQLVGANAEIQEMADGYRRAAEQEENLNRGLRAALQSCLPWHGICYCQHGRKRWSRFQLQR